MRKDINTKKNRWGEIKETAIQRIYNNKLLGKKVVDIDLFFFLLIELLVKKKKKIYGYCT
jgi:hypothetical protein